MNRRQCIAVACNMSLLWSLGRLTAGAQVSVAHGDHRPHHGGVVIMYGMDLHFEIVLTPQTQMRIYFSDGLRNDLPAALVTGVTVEIESPAAPTRVIELQIDPAGEYWAGTGAILTDADSTVRCAFVLRGRPVILSYPARLLLQVESPPGAIGPPQDRPRPPETGYRRNLPPGHEH